VVRVVEFAPGAPKFMHRTETLDYGIRQIADELKSKLGVRPDDITINMVFVKQEDWSFGRGEPWN
jgi:hypothetical protein